MWGHLQGVDGGRMRRCQELERAVEGVLAQKGCERHARQQPQVVPARPDRPLRHAQLCARKKVRSGALEKQMHADIDLSPTYQSRKH